MVDIVKHAIRTASDWTANQTAMEALYGVGGYYTLLSTWEADIPSDLVTDDEQWVADCYNDWPSGLSDNITITTRTTDATRNIIITSPDSEWHKGVVGGGFKLKDDTYAHTIEIKVDNIVIEKIEISQSSIYKAAIYSSNWGNPLLVDKCITTGSGIGVRVTPPTDTSDIKMTNCLAVGNLLGFDQLYKAVSFYNNTAIDCETGFLGSSKPIDWKNNVAYGCTTDYDTNGSSDVSACSNNATSESTIDSSLGIVTDVASTDFTNAANDDYNLSDGSKLFNTGTDLSTDFTTDIRGQGINQVGSTYYFPIGAFTGITKSAIALNVATGDSWFDMTDAQKGVYGNRNYSLLSTWEADLSSDLVADNVKAQADCYDDWASGLDDTVEIVARNTDATRNIIVTSPESERHNGQVDSGFKMVYVASWDATFIARPYYTEISYLQIENTGNTKALMLYNNFGLIDSVIVIKHDSNSSAISVSGRSITIRNSITFGSNVSIAIGNFVGASISNCTVIGATTGVSDANTGTGQYQPVINTVCYDCTTAFLAANVFHPDSENNADDDGTALALGIGTIDDVASTDFTDAANDDYSLASGSALIDEGTDLSTDFTDDITGATRGTTWDIGSFEYFSLDPIAVNDSYTFYGNSIYNSSHSILDNDTYEE